MVVGKGYDLCGAGWRGDKIMKKTFGHLGYEVRIKASQANDGLWLTSIEYSDGMSADDDPDWVPVSREVQTGYVDPESAIEAAASEAKAIVEKLSRRPQQRR